MAGAGKEGKETGWSSAPQTLPLVLAMMREKEICRGNGDLSRVYVELQRGQDIMEIDPTEVHAYACGY